MQFGYKFDASHVIVYVGRVGKIMRKRHISVCIVMILTCSIFGCAKTTESTFVAETENVEPGDAEIEEEEETDTADKESEGEAESESHSETFSASGMALKDDTALLVTVTEYVSPTYNCVYEEYEYDSEGRVLRHIEFFHSDGRWEYEYDSAGNLSRETCYKVRGDEARYWIEYRDVYDGAGDEVFRIGSRYEGEGNLDYEIVYDSEGNKVKLTYYEEDKTIRRVIEYEGADLEMRIIDYDEQGNIVGRREFEYDAAGNMTLMVDYDADGNIEVNESHDCDTYRIIHHYWPTENVYDAAGNLIKRVDYDYEGNIEDVFEYTYDESGNLLQYMHNAVEYNASGVIEYEYDSAGNMTKEITVPDNQWKEYEYDSENRLIKLTEYLHGEVKHEYGYEYRVIDG